MLDIFVVQCVEETEGSSLSTYIFGDTVALRAVDTIAVAISGQ